VTPFVDFAIDLQRLVPLWALGDDDLCAAFVHVFDDPVRIECLVGDQTTEFDLFNQRSDANRIMTLPGQKNETDQIAERIGQGQDLGRQAAL